MLAGETEALVRHMGAFTGLDMNTATRRQVMAVILYANIEQRRALQGGGNTWQTKS